jgi:hypothetical protein
MPASHKKQAQDRRGARRTNATGRRAERPGQVARRSSRSAVGRPTDDAVVLDARRRTEVRHLSFLFLVSSISLLLFMSYAFAGLLHVGLPEKVDIAWLGSMASGWAATWFYGIYVTILQRRWFWVVLVAIPVTSVPCAVAYAWTRRMEIEEEVLGDQGERTRNKRGAR